MIRLTISRRQITFPPPSSGRESDLARDICSGAGHRVEIIGAEAFTGVQATSI
jgi:hypothetical protein